MDENPRSEWAELLSSVRAPDAGCDAKCHQPGGHRAVWQEYRVGRSLVITHKGDDRYDVAFDGAKALTLRFEEVKGWLSDQSIRAAYQLDNPTAVTAVGQTIAGPPSPSPGPTPEVIREMQRQLERAAARHDVDRSAGMMPMSGKPKPEERVLKPFPERALRYY